MKVFLIYKNDRDSYELVKIILDKNKALEYSNKMNESRNFFIGDDGEQHYSEFYEFEEWEVD